MKGETAAIAFCKWSRDNEDNPEIHNMGYMMLGQENSELPPSSCPSWVAVGKGSPTSADFQAVLYGTFL